MVLPSDAGCSKPNKAIFDKAVQASGVAAGMDDGSAVFLYVGDSVIFDAQGAAQAGMQSVLVGMAIFCAHHSQGVLHPSRSISSDLLVEWRSNRRLIANNLLTSAEVLFTCPSVEMRPIFRETDSRIQSKTNDPLGNVDTARSFTSILACRLIGGGSGRKDHPPLRTALLLQI